MKKVLMAITPKWLKKFIYFQFQSILTEERRKQSEQIPKFNLDEKHISNVRLLKDRSIMLDLLPKNAVVAELGVDNGDFSEKILNQCTPEKFHLIDFWGSKRYHQGKRLKVEKRFEEELMSGDVEINLGLSTEVVDKFPDNYFDWIYIDTDHSYYTTSKELELYRPKMKDNGIICGHDYIVGNWDGMVRYGVIEAVAEFCIKYDWELQYITTELDNFPSFAIRKS